MPNSFAIEIAVLILSPVIIMGLIPAFKHNLIDSLEVSLGGSIIATRPIKSSLFSTKLYNSWFFNAFNSFIFDDVIFLVAIIKTR